MLQCPRYKSSSSCGTHKPHYVILYLREAIHKPRQARLLRSCRARDPVPSSGDPYATPRPPQRPPFPASPPTPPARPRQPTGGAIRSGRSLSALKASVAAPRPGRRGTGGVVSVRVPVSARVRACPCPRVRLPTPATAAPSPQKPGCRRGAGPAPSGSPRSGGTPGRPRANSAS